MVGRGPRRRLVVSDVTQLGLLQIGDLLGSQRLRDHAFGLLEPPALQVRSGNHRHADVGMFVRVLRRVFVPEVEHASVIVMQMLDANSGFKNTFGIPIIQYLNVSFEQSFGLIASA